MLQRFLAVVSAAAILLTACAKEEQGTVAGDSSQATSSPSAATPVAGAPASPAPGRRVIVVELVTNEKGNFFEPSEIEAEKGDVIRFTLRVGVHNVHFLPDSNAAKTELPPASEMLQLPGQTYDLPVTFAPGTYYFQCDPHAALGMRGHLRVEE